MGFYCCNCKHIFDDHLLLQICDGCKRNFCIRCSRILNTFFFNNKNYCDICWYKKSKKKIKLYFFCWDISLYNNTNENHVCGDTKCRMIDQNFLNFDGYLKGICCIKRYPEKPKEWCLECYKAYHNYPQIITFILCMKYTKILPMDIAKMIGKIIWEKGSIK